MNILIHFQKNALLLLLLVAAPLATLAQQDPRDEFYTPPANSKFLKASSGSSSGVYEGDYNWAIRYYPARLWYTTTYLGFERTVTKWLSASVDAGLHGSRAGFSINALGPSSAFDGEFDGPSVPSTLSYSQLLLNGTQITNNIPTVGFSLRFFPDEKEGHNVSFIQLQYQYTGTSLAMNDFGRERFAGGSDTANLQLQTAMVRFGRQWTYGNKIKILNEFSIGIGVNMRLSSAYQAVTVTTGTPGSINYDFYYLNSLSGETQRALSPRFQFAYSIGIGY